MNIDQRRFVDIMVFKKNKFYRSLPKIQTRAERHLLERFQWRKQRANEANKNKNKYESALWLARRRRWMEQKKRGGGESGTLIDQSERAREKNSSI